MKKKLYSSCQFIKTCFFLLVIIIGFTLSSFSQLASWRPAGSTDFPSHRSGIWFNGMCRIPQFIFDPNDSRTMLAVSAQGGLFKSTDEGLNWNPLHGMENIPLHCASICIDRTNSSVVFAGTGDPDYYSPGDGVWKSTDGGQTFHQSGLSGQLVLQIIQDPANPASFTAATSAGVFRSFDGGQTWSQSLLNVIVSGVPTTIPLSGIFADMKKNADPASRILYACTAEHVSVFYRSLDFGDHWEIITNGITSVPSAYIQNGGRIGVTKADPDRIYLFWNGGLGMIYMSTDGGNTFQLRKPEGPPNLTGYGFGNNTGSGQGNYNSAFFADNTNPDRIWYFAHTMSVSEDGGLTFNLLHASGDGIHTDAKMMAQTPDNPNKLWASNDGGLWYSTDRGVTWTPRSNGLFAYEIGWNAGKGSRTRSDVMQIGTQDNGCLSMDGNKWYTMWTGDDYIFREFDYLPDGGNLYYPNETKNRQVAHSFWQQNSGIPVDKFSDIVFNRKETDLSFISDDSPGSKIFRTMNLSAPLPSWAPVTTLPERSAAMNSPIANPDRFYILTKNGHFYFSSNARSADPAFSQSATTFPFVRVASIATIANDANKVYMAVNERVYYSANGGQNWQDITYNLPIVYHRRILAEDYGGSSELVFLATSNAVYYKKAGQTSWTIYSSGLPARQGPTDFSMYDDSTGHSRLRYASYGLGIYETGFDNLRPLEAIIDVPDSSVINCSSSLIKIKDASNGKLNTPISYSWSFPGGTPSTSTAAEPEVSYPATGNYSISLTITDALNNRSSTTVNRFMQKVSCKADTLPGRALVTSEGPNYAISDQIDLGTTNTITMSAWVKTGSIQPLYTGIIFSNYTLPVGILLQDNNKLGFIWNGQYQNLQSGLTLPDDNKWHHVAVTTGPDRVTVYMDGFSHTFTGLNLVPVRLNTTWCIGNDDNNVARTFLGQIDEVCIYTRELSTQEIREQMNLTKNYGTVDPSLKVYYQFNDYGRIIFNKAGQGNARMYGKAALVRSTAPVGSGVAQTINVNTGSTVLFDRTDLQLEFPSTGTYPDGPIVATRLYVSPDDSASLTCLPSPKLHYWILRNYGSNAVFSPLTGMTFKSVPGTTPALAASPADVRLYKRAANDEGSTWGSSISPAATVTANSGSGTINFTTGLANIGFSQLMIGYTNPFELISFTGQNENNLTALLSWIVGRERSGMIYTVERGTDGINFNQLGTVPASGATAYQLRDLHPVPGINYYRLAIKDVNGNIIYSSIVTLRFEAVPLTFVLAPVPVNNTVTLRLNKPAGTALQLQLLDAAGQLVYSSKLANGITSELIDMARFSSGMYVLVILDEKGDQLFKKRFNKLTKAP